jgi:hypothetical protein
MLMPDARLVERDFAREAEARHAVAIALLLDTGANTDAGVASAGISRRIPRPI